MYPDAHLCMLLRFLCVRTRFFWTPRPAPAGIQRDTKCHPGLVDTQRDTKCHQMHHLTLAWRWGLGLNPKQLRLSDTLRPGGCLVRRPSCTRFPGDWKTEAFRLVRAVRDRPRNSRTPARHGPAPRPHVARRHTRGETAAGGGSCPDAGAARLHPRRRRPQAPCTGRSPARTRGRAGRR